MKMHPFASPASPAAFPPACIDVGAFAMTVSPRSAVPRYMVTGVQLDGEQRVVKVRWFMADRTDDGLVRALTPESVVDTIEVVDKLLDAEPVAPLFFMDAGTQEIGAVIKVHVQDDGTELIEVDDPRSHPGRTLLDLPRLDA